MAWTPFHANQGLSIIPRMKTSPRHPFTAALFAVLSLLLGGCGFTQGKKGARRGDRRNILNQCC